MTDQSLGLGFGFGYDQWQLGSAAVSVSAKHQPSSVHRTEEIPWHTCRVYCLFACGRPGW